MAVRECEGTLRQGVTLLRVTFMEFYGGMQLSSTKRESSLERMWKMVDPFWVYPVLLLSSFLVSSFFDFRKYTEANDFGTTWLAKLASDEIF